MQKRSYPTTQTAVEELIGLSHVCGYYLSSVVGIPVGFHPHEGFPTGFYTHHSEGNLVCGIEDRIMILKLNINDLPPVFLFIYQ